MNEIEKPDKCSEHDCNNKAYAKDKITRDQWRWVCKKHHFQFAYGIDYPRETVRGGIRMNKKTDYEKIIGQVINGLNKGTVKKDTLIKIIEAMETQEQFIKETQKDIKHKKAEDKEYERLREETERYLKTHCGKHCTKLNKDKSCTMCNIDEQFDRQNDA